jgi:hypothetical protein
MMASPRFSAGSGLFALALLGRFVRLTCGTLAVLGLLTSAWAASEPVMLKAGDVEIEKSAPLEITADLPPAPAGKDAVLEFTAWYQGKVFSGYHPGMRVYWDGKELTAVLDRPETFQIKDGREVSSRVSMKWNVTCWNVAILDAPESASLTTSKYFVSPETLDVVRFRFALPDASAGEHLLKIENGGYPDDDNTMTLMVRDIQIAFAPQ